MRLIIPDKSVKLDDPRLNLSGEIQPKAVVGGIFDFFRDHFRPEETSDVVFSLTIMWVGMDVSVKFGDSRSSRS